MRQRALAAHFDAPMGTEMSPPSATSATRLEQHWRELNYAEGCKPRPLFRGALHGIGTVLLVVGFFVVVAGVTKAPASSWHRYGLATGLGGKALTYGASATFHLYPFRSVQGVTKAFIADLFCIPFAVVGTVAPFVPEPDRTLNSSDGSDQLSSPGMHVGLAVAVLLANACCVWRQTRGQDGLETQPGRSVTQSGSLCTSASNCHRSIVGRSHRMLC
eukprot:gnl/MRDRNA2_/MRDRNA2_59682_c0_seq2.p1 gnl/MRDRNA2_/MRDRNA2_59682_c0~~gnl/MRDRNA2_/MRDRNA2_59682_c0_seq2.p1  ORF type:complete len:217 (-),score=14.47 gnl/MRDRNA2_/MRDRNA2_59682_c0_seq2:30-680(-)